MYLFDAKLDELWNTDIDRTILGGVALNSTAYMSSHPMPTWLRCREKTVVLFEVTLPGNSTVPAVASDTMVFVKTQIGQLIALNADEWRDRLV